MQITTHTHTHAHITWRDGGRVFSEVKWGRKPKLYTTIRVILGSMTSMMIATFPVMPALPALPLAVQFLLSHYRVAVEKAALLLFSLVFGWGLCGGEAHEKALVEK